MSSLLILGAGGHGKVVADAAREQGAWGDIAFLDDFQAPGTEIIGARIIGAFAQLTAQRPLFASAIVALGEARQRLQLLAQCASAGFELATVVHPAASVSRFATLGAGTVVLAQAAINAGSQIGVGCIVNTGSTVDHDCLLAEGVHVCPGAHLAGAVRIGAGSWIGVGSSVRESVVIGSYAKVGAGAAVVADVPDGVLVVGVPAKQRGAIL